MCDASDLAIVVYYARKTLNEAQRNYTTTEKEMLAMVYALEKFRAHLVGYDIVIFTYHSALKYLLCNDPYRIIQDFNNFDQV